MSLSLVIPTLNEAENVPRILHWTGRVLRDIDHEIIIVDDGSRDGTPEAAERNAHRVARLRVMRRNRTPGLSASILDGFTAARGDVLAVMDADLQHDPKVLPRLVAELHDHELAIGSRYAFRGRTCGWSRIRETESRAAAWLTRAVLGLTIKDPLSGFFALRREVFERAAPRLETEGWKILLELLVRANPRGVAEVPFTFKPRRFGQTKMNRAVVTAWLHQLATLRNARCSVTCPSVTRSSRCPTVDEVLA